MKRCPKCGSAYNDDALNFCLEDGEWLVAADQDEPETALLHRDGVPDITFTRSEDQSKIFSTSRKKWQILLVIGIVTASIAGYLIYRSYIGESVSTIDSIAVLPFANETGSPDAEYLSDGMTEMLISKLSRLPNLNVKARSTVFRYKSQPLNIKSVASELNVNAVLTGRVSRAGDQLAVNLELVESGSQNVLWSEHYLKPQGDIVDLQRTITNDVIEKVRAKLNPELAQKIKRQDTVNNEAYRNYLQGRFHWNKRTREGIERSITYLNQAIEADPQYALAYAGLADSYALAPFYADAEAQDSSQKAKAAAQKALELDGSIAEAYAALGVVKKWFDFQGPEAEKDFQRAIELNPNYPTAHHWYALFLATRERHEEADEQIRKALELDPLSVGINMDLGVTLFYARQFDEAEKQLLRTIEMDSGILQTHLFLATTYEHKRMFETAADSWANVIRIAGGDPSVAAGLKEAFATNGPAGFYSHKLKILLRRWDRTGSAAVDIAEVYSIQRQADKAFEWLDRAFEKRDISLQTIRVTPGFDNIRQDARFGLLLKELNLD